MAATGYTPISLYYSTTASAVPTAGNLANGELALNIADMKLYAKNSSGTVTLLASNASTTGVDSLSFGSTGLTPSTATTGAITVAGTLNVANGGTGLTSLTAGYIPFGNGTSALGNTSNLFWDSANARLGIGTSSPNFKTHISTGSTTSITQPTAGSYGLYVQQNTSGSTGGIYIQDGASNSGNSLFIADNNGVGRFVVDTDGNVSINSSNSRTKLFVASSNASDTITLGAVSGSFFVTNSNTNYGLQSGVLNSGNSWLQVMRTDGNATVYDLLLQPSGGNVGVGTTSPSSAIAASNLGFVLNGGANGVQFKLQNNTTGSTSSDGILLSLDASSNGYLWNYENATLVFGTNNTERFRFGASGQFGIAGANFGTSGQVLTSQGSGSAPTWASASGGITSIATSGGVTGGTITSSGTISLDTNNAGGVGSYCLAQIVSTGSGNGTNGAAITSGNLRAAGSTGPGSGNAWGQLVSNSMSGTWRACGAGTIDAYGGGFGIFQRIS